MKQITDLADSFNQRYELQDCFAEKEKSSSHAKNVIVIRILKANKLELHVIWFVLVWWLRALEGTGWGGRG